MSKLRAALLAVACVLPSTGWATDAGFDTPAGVFSLPIAVQGTAGMTLSVPTGSPATTVPTVAIASYLGVMGGAGISNGLVVSGGARVSDGILTDALAVTGNVGVMGALTITGMTTLNSRLLVGGASVFSGAVIMNNGANITGTVAVAGTISAQGEIRVGEDGTSCGGTTAGTMRFDTGSHTMQYCDGGSWQQVGGSSTPPSGTVCGWMLDGNTYTYCQGVDPMYGCPSGYSQQRGMFGCGANSCTNWAVCVKN